MRKDKYGNGLCNIMQLLQFSAHYNWDDNLKYMLCRPPGVVAREGGAGAERLGLVRPGVEVEAGPDQLPASPSPPHHDAQPGLDERPPQNDHLRIRGAIDFSGYVEFKLSCFLPMSKKRNLPLVGMRKNIYH